MTAPVLIVEDAASVAAAYAETLAAAGLRSEVVGRVADARARLGAQDYAAVLLDLILPDGDGFGVLRALGRDPAPPPVVAITSDGSIRRAVEATRLGAVDFLVKPASDRRLLNAVGAAIRTRAAETDCDSDEFGIMGCSPAIRALRKRIRRVAGSEAPVFITGESGVGKELCAHAAHRASKRAPGPFIALNCAAIPGDLLESILFGHVRGAFTGAHADNAGAARSADGGTLFLDEICEMAPALQTKLLRFLETASVTPVGAANARPVDVRLIAATNRDPEEEMRAGRFREDLYYRLHVLPLHAPPLRKRGGDARIIAEHLLTRFAALEGRSVSGFSDDALAALAAHSWPGNVRELINVIRRAVVLGEGGRIEAAHLGLPATGDPARSETGRAGAAPASLDTLCRLPMAEVERRVILAAIETHGGAPAAAKSLGLSPSTIYRKLEIWGLRREKPPRQTPAAFP